MQILRKIVFFSFPLFLLSCASKKENTAENFVAKANAVLKEQVLAEAEKALLEQPITVTNESSSRSAGGKHDFYSEGDYWWPDEKNPDAPYVQRDGLTNPENFVAHRLAMIRLCKIVGALASAYKLTGDEKYAKQVSKHLEAWFINSETKMNPNLQFAQAIKGRFTGRGIGIIDTIQLMDVAQGTLVLQNTLEKSVFEGVQKWFSEYLNWMMTNQNGKDEMNAKNNHGTCFVMQVASFAKLTNNKELLTFCSTRYKTVLLPNQMAQDGSFPLEMARTKPYGYALFNLDAMVTLCQILSTKEDNLWEFTTSDGLTIKKGIEFMYPFVADKSKWTLQPDVMYWDEWPVAQPAFIFGANAYNNEDWFLVWKKLQHNPQVQEVVRNLTVKNPIIWMN
ncbi:MAG: alginate lyase family protein [Flavobacterium sp.]|nr:alginate lyase family protein [Flavobacterium sp.]